MFSSFYVHFVFRLNNILRRLALYMVRCCIANQFKKVTVLSK